MQQVRLGEAILLRDQGGFWRSGAVSPQAASLRAAGACVWLDGRTDIGVAGRMGSIGRYIFRTTSGAFLVVLVSVTAFVERVAERTARLAGQAR
jgi:hypothetical protein